MYLNVWQMIVGQVIYQAEGRWFNPLGVVKSMLSAQLDKYQSIHTQNSAAIHKTLRPL